MIDEKSVKKDEKIENEKNQTMQEHVTEMAENMIPKSRFDQVNQQKKDALAVLNSVADELANDVPKDMQDLIPDLAPAEKIIWIRQAIKKGIFNENLENGLDSKRPTGKVPIDLTGMSPMDMMRHGYKQ